MQHVIRIVPLLVLFALGGLCHAAAAQDAPMSIADVVKAAGDGVVTVRVYDRAGRATSLGSGFILSDGRVVTNAHVLEGGSRAEVVDRSGRLLGVTQHADALSMGFDLAILPQMGQVPGHLELAETLPSIGEQVIAIGAPEGLSNTVSDGIVSAFRQSPGRNWIQITAPVSPGSSGGPVLNDQAQVVGVSVAQVIDGQNLNFAIPVGDVRALQSSPPGENAFPMAERSGPAASRNGETDAAILTVSQTRDFQHFAFGMVGCAWRGSLARCVLRVENTDSARTESTKLALNDVLLQGDNFPRTRAALVQFDGREGRVGRDRSVAAQIEAGDPVLLTVDFPKLALNARGAALTLMVSSGRWRRGREITFDPVEIIRPE